MTTGKIEAPSEDQAVNILHQKNLAILSLEKTRKGLLSRDITTMFSRPSHKDVVLFTRQMATLIEADVPLVEGLHILSRQVEKGSFKKIVSTVVSSIEGGAPLSVALAEHSKVFNRFYISLVRAGEATGKLQTTLTYLAEYLERSASLNSKIKGALAYPAFVLSAMVIVTMLLMTTVLPQLLSVINDAGITDIPVTTRVLMAVTGFINKYLFLLVTLMVGGFAMLVYYVKTPRGRERFDNFKIKMPRFGEITRNFYLARIAETLATLIKSDVPILDGIGITADVVGNDVYRGILLQAKENVRGGGTISQVFEKYSEIPPLVSSMLIIGEKTGKTDFVLENIFNFYKTESENSIQNLSQLIEPVLILVLGIGVGLLVSAVLLPIYSLVGAG
ncbi:MAG: type II secretion system F family protein [Candidatus Yanofskybacteria bacterium]|nr:type II secretion system F family protein [Candidatus Yanofskybacteria bacterium]